MKNNIATFSIAESNAFKIKMLNWSGRFNIFCFLDNNGYQFEEPRFECMLAAGAEASVSLNRDTGLKTLQSFYDTQHGWLFGHLGYDLLNNGTQPGLPPGLDVSFGDGFFFKPSVLVTLHGNTVTIESASEDTARVFEQINCERPFIHEPANSTAPVFQSMSAEDYKDTIKKLKEHIHRGDCYEINYCQSFFAEGISINPAAFYRKLSLISPNPFSAFYRINEAYCFCASPERFLKKTGNRLVSQPIKGTGKRNPEHPEQDIQARNHLRNSEKEKAENVMVVDLVRNDLSRVCQEGSVHVSELFGIYSFPQVHQMISTIEGQVGAEMPLTTIIEACFPMGSMTGAPKIKVMELINKYEQYPRGLFSGSIGYITPEGDFDFNVVIRSLMYDDAKKLVSFKTGGGITFNSNPDQEYEECMIKAEAIMKAITVS